MKKIYFSSQLWMNANNLILFFLLGICSTGCNPNKKDQGSSVVPVTPNNSTSSIPSDSRTRWVYEKGSFVKGQGDNWFEHNDEAQRIRGKAWEFRQIKSTKEYVEIYDASRGVSIRLSDASAAVRWDKDGKDAKWEELFPGKWESQK